MRQLFTFVCLASFAAGCAHREARAPKAANPSEVENVKRRAEVDLDCRDVSVDVIQEGNLMRAWTFAAKGCDKSATYLSRMGTIIRN